VAGLFKQFCGETLVSTGIGGLRAGRNPCIPTSFPLTAGSQPAPVISTTKAPPACHFDDRLFCHFDDRLFCHFDDRREEKSLLISPAAIHFYPAFLTDFPKKLKMHFDDRRKDIVPQG